MNGVNDLIKFVVVDVVEWSGVGWSGVQEKRDNASSKREFNCMKMNDAKRRMARASIGSAAAIFLLQLSFCYTLTHTYIHTHMLIYIYTARSGRPGGSVFSTSSF